MTNTYNMIDRSLRNDIRPLLVEYIVCFSFFSFFSLFLPSFHLCFFYSNHHVATYDILAISAITVVIVAIAVIVTNQQNRSASMIDMYIDNSEPSENVGQIHFCVEYDFQNTTLILKILQVIICW